MNTINERTATAEIEHCECEGCRGWKEEWGDEEGTTRVCEDATCGKEFSMYDPHYYDDDQCLCYCCKECYKNDSKDGEDEDDDDDEDDEDEEEEEEDDGEAKVPRCFSCEYNQAKCKADFVVLGQKPPTPPFYLCMGCYSINNDPANIDPRIPIIKYKPV